MDGEVIYFDAERGIGFIAGRDGNRYVFDRADLAGMDRVAKGMKVAFEIVGDRARQVQASARQAGGAAAEARAPAPPGVQTGSVPAVAAAGGATVAAGGIQEEGPTLGVFGYFRRCVTGNYINIGGRARRAEFWSFALVSVAAIIAMSIVGLVADFAVGNLTEVQVGAQTNVGGAPYLAAASAGLTWLLLLVPSLAVTVRRIHDIGLSGWFILLNFVPSVGSLIILVFMLIPSQRHPNKWGPIPAGLRI